MNLKFVNIALDLPIDKLFTYKVPDFLDEFVEPGKRVLVNFGKKTITGVIVEIVEASDFKKTKDVKSFLDSGRIFNDEYLEFSKWISNYYVSPIGEVIFSSLPSKINLKTEKYYRLNNDYRLNIDKSKLQSEIYWDILDAYQGNLDIQFTKQQIENKLNTKNLTSYLSLLEEKNILTSYVSFSKTTNEKYVKIVTRNYNQSDFENISKNLKSKIQKEILELFTKQESFEFSELVQKFKSAYSAINSLHKKNLVKLEEVRKFRNYTSLYQERNKTIEFTDEQKFSFEKIDEAIAGGKFNPFLLFGITGSGKTEIYLDAIAKVIGKGKTAIVLVPEISLTPQLIYRFQQRFGDIIGVIHSRISEGQKLDTFDRIFNGLIK